MTDRKRDPLPQGYQFGDARRQPSVVGRSGATFLFDDEASAARFAALCADPAIKEWAKAWNVIEADHFTADRDLGDEA